MVEFVAWWALVGCVGYVLKCLGDGAVNHGSIQSPGLKIIPGHTERGALEINLSTDGANVFIGGATGSGKTMMVNAILLQLLENYPDIAVFVHDGKLGAGYKPFFPLPNFHMIPLDGLESQLQAILSEVDSRNARFAGLENCWDIEDYNQQQESPLNYWLVVIDEFSHLAKKKNIMEKLVEMACRCRSAGIFLMMATQRKTDKAVGNDLTDNFGVRIALRVLEESSSKAIIGSPEACHIPASKKGQAIYRGDELITFQGFYLSSGELVRRIEKIKEIER
ncbi:MAG: FtsK/SpoIIIE domain-containing protein [Turicibacter sp.]|nr:FtsK/SpoIIIE domain-containing protein [Turicibacter sp.]